MPQKFNAATKEKFRATIKTLLASQYKDAVLSLLKEPDPQLHYKLECR